MATTGVYFSRPWHIKFEHTVHPCMSCSALMSHVACVCVCVCVWCATDAGAVQLRQPVIPDKAEAEAEQDSRHNHGAAGQQPPLCCYDGGSTVQAADGMQWRPVSNGLPGSSQYVPTDNLQRQQGPWPPAASCSVYVSKATHGSTLSVTGCTPVCGSSTRGFQTQQECQQLKHSGDDAERFNVPTANSYKPLRNCKMHLDNAMSHKPGGVHAHSSHTGCTSASSSSNSSSNNSSSINKTQLQPVIATDRTKGNTMVRKGQKGKRKKRRTSKGDRQRSEQQQPVHRSFMEYLTIKKQVGRRMCVCWGHG